jgi:DNA-binding transcriptional LysR family regulator
VNIHHLELFYYVARHGGISRAVRHMPYGIQQPAVSSQVLQLEEDLGVRLFERSPFQLTPEGEQLYAFVRPFFENLDATAAKLRQRATPMLRLGAAEMVLRDHLPAVMAQLRASQPGLQLALRSGFTPELHAWLQDRQIDLAITPLEGRLPARVRSLRLLRVPLVLLVPRKSRLKNATEVWARNPVVEPLISLPASEVISRQFQKSLRRLGVEWPLAIEASSLELVVEYVANGYGYGVNVEMPGLVEHPQVRVLPLEGFEPVEIVALWRGEPTPVIQAVLEQAQTYVRQQWPEWVCGKGEIAQTESAASLAPLENGKKNGNGRKIRAAGT